MRRVDVEGMRIEECWLFSEGECSHACVISNGIIYFVAVSCRSCCNGTVELGRGEEGGGGGRGNSLWRSDMKERGKM